MKREAVTIRGLVALLAAAIFVSACSALYEARSHLRIATPASAAPASAAPETLAACDVPDCPSGHHLLLYRVERRDDGTFRHSSSYVCVDEAAP